MCEKPEFTLDEAAAVLRRSVRRRSWDVLDGGADIFWFNEKDEQIADAQCLPGLGNYITLHQTEERRQTLYTAESAEPLLSLGRLIEEEEGKAA